MTGVLIRADSPAQVRSHHVCPQPPALMTWDFTGERPRIADRIPDGSIWVCDCGRGQVVYSEPDHVSPYGGLLGGPEWRPMKRREMRRRLKALRPLGS